MHIPRIRNFGNPMGLSSEGPKATRNAFARLWTLNQKTALGDGGWEKLYLHRFVDDTRQVRTTTARRKTMTVRRGVLFSLFVFGAGNSAGSSN